MSKEALLRILSDRTTQIVAASLVSAAGGAVVGHLVTKRRLQDEYDAMLDSEIESARDFYRRQNKAEEFSDPSKLAAKYDEAQQDTATPEEEAADKTLAEVAKSIAEKQVYINYSSPVEAVEQVAQVVVTADPEPVLETHNVFTNPPEDPDEIPDFIPDLEREKLRQNQPYILDKDEFYENENNLAVNQLTWYAKDSVLADEEERPIPDVRGIIGGEHNLRFGYGSGDPELVFIHNPRYNVYCEVSYDPGAYGEEILGQGVESRNPGLRKMRDSDE